MGYEANPAGLGVSKRYGALNLGGVGGVTTGENGYFTFVGEVSAKELAATPEISFSIPDGRAVVTGVFVEVETAFGTGDTLDVLLAGSTILTGQIAVSSTGIVAGTLSAGLKVLNSGQAITLDVTAIDAGDLDGYAKVVVELKRI